MQRAENKINKTAKEGSKLGGKLMVPFLPHPVGREAETKILDLAAPVAG